MANFGYADDNSFNAIMSGGVDRSLHHYIGSKVNQFTSALGNMASGWVDSIRQRYDSYNIDQMEMVVDNYKRANDHMWTLNDVRPLSTIDELNQASFIMQRWIMANPVLRKAWQAGYCHGYGNDYVDLEPGAIDWLHTDYAKVNNGIQSLNDDGNYVSTTYSQAYNDDGLEELSFREQQDILHTWEAAEYFFGLGEEDPTSQEGTLL